MQVYYWIGLNLILLGTMFAFIPFNQIRQLFLYGLFGGTVLSLFIFYLAHILKLWKIIGGINLFQFPILPAIAWFFPTVGFGHFYPKDADLLYRIGFISLFATFSVVFNYIFVKLGMWKSIQWNYFYTFLLASVAHIFLSFLIVHFDRYIERLKILMGTD